MATLRVVKRAEWNHEKIFVTLSVLGLLIGVPRFYFLLKSSSTRAAPTVSDDVLFLPSPLESDLLSLPEVWGRTFSAENPPLPDRVPELYAAGRAAQASLMKDDEWEHAREWSVALNSLNKTRLESVLPSVPDPAEVLSTKTKQTCSRLEQEWLFRWAQFNPLLKKDFGAYMRDCAPKNVVTDWLVLEEAIRARKPERIEAAMSKLRLRAFLPEKTWSMYFGTKAVKAGQLAQAEAEARAAKEEQERYDNR